MMQIKIREMQNKINSELVINRIKNKYHLANNGDVARFLGISPGTLSGWVGSRGIGNWELIFAKCKEMDFNFLIYGEYLQNENLDNPQIVSETKVDYATKCQECKQKDKMIDRLERENERLLKFIDRLDNQNQTKVANCG